MKTLEKLDRKISLCNKNVPIKWILITVATIIVLAILVAAIPGCTINQEDGSDSYLADASLRVKLLGGSRATHVAAGGNTDKIEKIRQDPNNQPGLRQAEVLKANVASNEAIKKKQIDNGQPVTSKERTIDKALDKNGLVNNVKDVLGD
jgi:hypothetical protein